MKKVIGSEKVPIKMWLDEIEEGALKQARNLANLPFVFKQVALMPDSHQGYGMPIGGVLATKEVVIPNAVGVDIGCGMCAVQTPLTETSHESLQTIVDEIRATVPTGFSHHKEAQDKAFMPQHDTVSELFIVSQQLESAMYQVGTLGGGNHFIEIQKGSDGHIWIMIHSGSRNIGYKVAKHYNKLAVKLNEKWFSSVPKSHELAFLPFAAEEGQAYLREMQYCVDFALANRKLMMSRIVAAFNRKFPDDDWNIEDKLINIAHNYAALEHHFNHNVMVHRKGATQAREGQTGIIPGSQGTSSYIVTGKGSRESFMSCSHGAGRKMGRKQAIRELSLEQEQASLNAKGIIHSITAEKDLDEAPSAYKNIDTVMENQADLVDTTVELTPLAVVKG